MGKCRKSRDWKEALSANNSHTIVPVSSSPTSESCAQGWVVIEYIMITVRQFWLNAKMQRMHKHNITGRLGQCLQDLRALTGVAAALWTVGLLPYVAIAWSSDHACLPPVRLVSI